MSESAKSTEQMCRDLLERAERCGIVTFSRENFVSTKSIQELTAGDLCEVANLLNDYLAAAKADLRKRLAVCGVALRMSLTHRGNCQCVRCINIRAARAACEGGDDGK